MKKQQIVAAAILVAVIAWMAVPRDTSSTAEEPEVPERQIAAIPEGASPAENPEQITVRARQISEEDYVERIRVRGRTQAFRHVQVRAEQAGRIISDPVCAAHERCSYATLPAVNNTSVSMRVRT